MRGTPEGAKQHRPCDWNGNGGGHIRDGAWESLSETALGKQEPRAPKGHV